MPGTPLLELVKIRKTFADRVVLDAVDLTVAPGEIVTLIGPNGAGKSTLARLALGLVKPDGGTIRRRPGLRIGYMPQKVQVDRLMPLSAERFLHLRPGAERAAVRQCLARVGLSGHGDTPVQGLSGGEFQRLMLARALLGRPELLVLDEPVQGVDVGGQAALYRLIGDVRRETGCAILMVSHDLHLVMSSTDRVICLNRHVCCAGEPMAVRQDPAYRALFGTDADVLALYTHNPGHDHRHHHHTHSETPGDPA